MTENEAKKELCTHIEYLKHNWKPHPDYDVLEAINIAINSLEKQILKKAIITGHNNAINTDVGYCPICKGVILMACDNSY